MMKDIARFFIGTALIGLCAANGPAFADEVSLSRVQRNVIDAEIAALRSSEERALASQWTDAKKVAEFICRPLAMRELRSWNMEADRVFLGTDNPAALKLTSDRELAGSGEVRTGDNWTDFSFTCTLDPQTGQAESFQTNLP